AIRSSGSCTTTPPPRPRTTETRPFASRMRSASRSEGRETPNRSTSSGSWPSSSPSESSPETIRRRSSSAICWGFSRARTRGGSPSAGFFARFLARANVPPPSRGSLKTSRLFESYHASGMEAMEWSLSAAYDALAGATPDRDVLVWNGTRRTWAQVAARTRNFAAFLQRRGIGIRRERRDLERWECGQATVALLLYNCPEYIESMLGCFRARAVPFNVNQHYRSGEV